jgi:hypothetical protein
MKIIMKASILTALLLAMAVPQRSLADPASGCTNGNGSNYVDGLGDTLVAFTCSLYQSSGNTTIDLTPNLTYDGADYYTNLVGAGYVVDINGNPNSLSDDSGGLWNQSLWAAVLYWPGDQYGGYASDSLTVYWAGNTGFPAVSDVETFDENLSAFYGGIPDSEFFVQSSYPETVYSAQANEYDLYPTPEPSSLFLLGTGLFGLAVVVLRKVKSSGLVLHP